MAEEENFELDPDNAPFGFGLATLSGDFTVVGAALLYVPRILDDFNPLALAIALGKTMDQTLSYR